MGQKGQGIPYHFIPGATGLLLFFVFNKPIRTLAGRKSA